MPESSSSVRLLFTRNTRWIVFIVIGLTLFSLLVDLWESQTQNYRFYPVESLLFSFSYWILFAPLLIMLVLVARTPGIRPTAHIIRSATTFILHLLLYPALVWLISSLFYSHTYPYAQTFFYGVNEYFFLTLFVYSALCGFVIYRSTQRKSDLKINPDKNPHPTSIAHSLTVNSGLQKVKLETRHITHISANYPYTIVHTADKQYLFPENLKAALSQLDPQVFVQVHKSHAVNIGEVVSYKSRLNGDYDLVLRNGQELRVSRNYSSQFKMLFEKTHRLTQG